MILIIIIGSFSIGAVISSFLNLVGYRVPENISIVTPNSHCSSCKKELKNIDLIPVLSCLASRGRCRYCGSYYGIMHALIEFYIALMFALSSLLLIDNLYISLVLFLSIAIYNINRVSKDIHDKILFKTSLVLMALVLLLLVLNGNLVTLILGSALLVLFMIIIDNKIKITKKVWLCDIYIIVVIVFTLGVLI